MRHSKFNLYLAGFWLLLGAGILFWEALSGDKAASSRVGTAFSAGGLALLLAAYNLVRWWAQHSLTVRSELLRESEEGRRRPPPRTPPEQDEGR
jgi:hypothetical protein